MKHRSTTKKGDALELIIRDLLQTEIEADRFYLKKEQCKFYWKKGYFSKDRGSEIIFDVAIEVYLPGAEKYSHLVLIECKNYKDHVPVSDAEEFFSKVQQVAAANCKMIIASTAPFQHGAVEYARSKGIGLLRYFEPGSHKWELHRSSSATAHSSAAEQAETIASALTREDFASQAFDMYMQSPSRATNSLWDFFEDVLFGDTLPPALIRRITNPRSRLKSQVPFLTMENLERTAMKALSTIGYSGGEVNLDVLCSHEALRTGLVVETGVLSSPNAIAFPVLGRIQFEPPTIQVYAVEPMHRGRDRFTLAHELAHHLLDHGRFLIRESCDDGDFDLRRSIGSTGNDVARLELQANLLAASLLMPRAFVTSDFHQMLRTLEISDRGYGPLYVDDQPCNLQNFDAVVGHLMQRYGVSRSAAQIRLESMGLLHDARRRSGPQSIQSILAATAH
ncbi:ImmA/IrrE family metallo-endopeptidase [Variovorax sp. KBS0712]|uniref:ImmA/IrrE family metallo-endopeptidase n=1 Tax=Variovorax sp. KBS0712 TaxID=2578111 RepID=UPI00111A4FB4|nr:ImmA/IrrE family metallo-endopeptidase [Variovorax sp. KBS0712]TSD61488.1 ImmA/IrrE family metallo-endopeptidase [Variovorax sp. KBS0712]